MNGWWKRNISCCRFVGWNEWEMIILNEFLRCLHEELKIKAFLFRRITFCDELLMWPNYFIHKNKK